MSQKNDEDTHLRDQFALHAMQALITSHGLHKPFIENDNENPDSNEKLKRIAIIAYRVADEMRKARLQSFT
jgi:hypothetical protein